MTLASPLHFDHVGLNVADLDEAVRWYSANLDLEEDFAFAFQEFDFAGVMLVHASGWRIELICRRGARQGILADHPIAAALTLGYSHFAVRVDDVAATYQRLVSAGATHRLGPQPGPERRMPMAFVADPYGNLIEILTRIPVREDGAEQDPPPSARATATA